MFWIFWFGHCAWVHVSIIEKGNFMNYFSPKTVTILLSTRWSSRRCPGSCRWTCPVRPSRFMQGVHANRDVDDGVAPKNVVCSSTCPLICDVQIDVVCVDNGVICLLCHRPNRPTADGVVHSSTSAIICVVRIGLS